jgi:diaminohydroxyphosphoribosylaminopyrimidine deaminase/5-amino-6-(5-phosphoribosylamino)uracil reductase
MAHALTLAARGLGRVWPNPAVGCVIVAGDRVIGRGWTQAGGRPHAETVALAQAGEAARGATAYVSLEPCAHHGRAPPCAGALIAAGVARVVSAHEDPDTRVSGRGHGMLRAAGIAVETGVMEAEARALQAGFLTRVEKGRPHVTLKLALSLDGRIATASGESRWITGPEARRHVHLLRARSDAVMVGAGTVRADDPALTVRDLGVSHQPVRIVIAGGRPLSPDAVLARTAREAQVWVVHAEENAPGGWAAAGATLIPVPASRVARPDPDAALRALGVLGLTRILCEGGGTLAAGLLSAGLVDEVVTMTAGLALGADGRAGVGPLAFPSLAAARRFRLADARPLGPDLMSVWVPA